MILYFVYKSIIKFMQFLTVKYVNKIIILGILNSCVIHEKVICIYSVRFQMF